MSFKEEKPFKNVSIKICGMLDNNLAVINIASGNGVLQGKSGFS